MDKVMTSIVVDDMYGSAGSVTAYHRGGKLMFRKKVKRSFVGTPAQLAHLDVHRRAMAAWRGLPHCVQMIWNEHAKDVEPHRPPFDHSSWISGQNLFVSAYHGFSTLGNEHCPEPMRFETFPSFAVSNVSAMEKGDNLILTMTVSGLEHAEPSRYRLYGRLQMVEAGRGCRRASMWRSVQASESGRLPEVNLIVTDWQSIWPGLAGKPRFGLRGDFVLLDSFTGYRSQKVKVSEIVELQ